MVSKSENSLAVIIPMFNEEQNAVRCVEAIIPVLSSLHHTAHLFVVNDGSSDKTATKLKELQKKYVRSLTVVTHPKNMGYGKGLQTGIREAFKHGYTFGLFMDSDLTNDPKYIYDFEKYLDSPYDCVKASRYITGGMMRDVPFKRRIISMTGNAIAKRMFGLGINDCTNGFRMTRLSFVYDVSFCENGFPIILEELYILKKKNARCTEIPNTLTSRVGTKSHFRYTTRMFWNYFKYALKAALVPYNKK